MALDISSQGEVFVLDTINSAIKVFDLNGSFIRKFGSQGNLDGQFSLQSFSLSLDDSGNVFLADRGNKRISVFSSAGNFLYKFGTDSRNGDSNMLCTIKVLAKQV